MKLLLVDNHDSFSWNIAESCRKVANIPPQIIREDRIDPEELQAFDKIILSPGPEVPGAYPRMMRIIKRWAGIKPILGICLGCQAIAEHYGGQLLNLDQVFHGVAAEVHTESEDELLFRGIARPFTVGLYHSWAVADAGFPVELEVTARSEAGVIMALRHRQLDIRGMQFHPESIITPEGGAMLRNWLVGR